MGHVSCILEVLKLTSSWTAGLMASRAPEIPSWCEPEWAHLLERCWEPDPHNRPSLRHLSETLQRIIDEY